MSNKGVDVRNIDFNIVDDIRILLLLSDTKLDDLAKKYIIDNYVDRIKKMDNHYLCLLLNSLDLDMINKCSKSLKKIITSIEIKDLESLVYNHGSYQNVSKIIVELLKQEWFSKDIKNINIKLAYDIERIKDSEASENRIIRIGNKIISELNNENHNRDLSNKILKEFLIILDRNYKEYKEEFFKKGYEVINSAIKNNKNITENMIIFDSYMVKSLVIDNDILLIDFINDENKYIAYESEGRAVINLSFLKEINKLESTARKEKLLFIFFTISKVLEYASLAIDYLQASKNDKKLIQQLKVYNYSLCLALKKKNIDDINLISNHYANISSVKSIYKRYELLNCMNDQDKIDFNVYLAEVLMSVKTYPIKYTYDLYKKNVKKKISVPTSLDLIIHNLTNYEKFELGYDNIYKLILTNIMNREISTTNIFNYLKRVR